MRSFIGGLFIVWFLGHSPGVFAQSATTQSGFAVVTLESGNGAGLIATETIENRTSVGVEHAVLSPAVLITSASILVPVGPFSENTTAIAVANPSAGSGGVNFALTDTQGVAVLNTTIVLGPRAQFAKFLNEFFTTPPTEFTTPLLLTISSEIPVAVVAVNFRDIDFAALPLTSLSTPTPVAIQPLTAVAVVQPVAPPSPSITAPGFGLGVPPVPVPPMTVSPPLTITNSSAQTTVTIGGASSFVFPQVVTGGIWSTEIAIGNTSTGIQTVRIDFFSPDGALVRSVTDVTIPPRGVVFIPAGEE